MKAQVRRGVQGAGRLILVLALGIGLVYLPAAAQEDAAPAPKVRGLKSASLALSLSSAGVFLPWALGLSDGPISWTGLLIGPSLGYFYSGLWGRGMLGIGVRLLGGAAAIAGLFAGSPLVIGGMAVLVGSCLWDVLSVPGAVHRHNARLREKHLAMTPFYLPHSKSVGIQVSFSF